MNDILDSQILSFDALIVENPIDIFYLTKQKFSSAFLIRYEGINQLFVDGRYIEEARGAILRTEENIELFLKSHKTLKVIGFDADSTTYSNFIHLKQLCDKLNLTLVPTKSIIKKQRAIKTEDEILKMHQAAHLNIKSFEEIHPYIQEGITEEDIAIKLKIFWLKNGAYPSFEPIIAFGNNSSKPHHRSSERALKKDDIALVDIGCELNSYQSDATKTFFFGKKDPLLQKVYDAVNEALEETLLLCKPGCVIHELDAKARQILKKSSLDQFFKHSIGHGIGLNVHEYPQLKNCPFFSNTPLKESMCITIEPGVYLENLGGVRLEKSIVITKQGFQELGVM
jgi:Xaa-Pro aminopeptidase